MVDETIGTELEEKQTRYKSASIEADSIPIHDFIEYEVLLPLVHDTCEVMFFRAVPRRP